jgi:chromosome segregation ATPase
VAQSILNYYTVKVVILSLTKNKQSEVEQRVHQELKNYQSEIYQLNQSIQELKNTIVSLTKKQEDNIANMQSKHKAMEISNEHFTEYVKEVVHDCNVILDTYRDSIDKMDVQTRKSIEHCCNYVDKKDLHDHQFSVNAALNQQHAEITNAVSTIKAMCNSYTHLEKHCNSTIHAFAGEIPDIKPLRDYIDQKLQENAINLAGMTKEIETCKDKIYYGEKMFENIYTLLERKGIK